MAESLEGLIDKSTVLLIPSGRDAATEQRLTLDGRNYTLVLKWNQRASSWFLGLLDAENLPILLGARVITNWPLLRYKKWDPRCPPGELVAMSEIDNTDPKYEDFGIGKRVQLTYFSVNDA